MYDFKANALQNVHTVEVEQLETEVIKLPSKALKVAAKKNNDTQKTDDTATRKIGFFGKNSGGLNDTEKLSVNDTTKIVGGKNTTEFEPNSMTIVGGTETMGQCPNCLKSFIKNHKKHTYCSDECRGEFWQKKTNRTLHKNKSGKN